MKLFATAGYCHNIHGKFNLSPGYIICETEERAIEVKLQSLYQTCPPSQGWTYHTVNVIEILLPPETNYEAIVNLTKAHNFLYGTNQVIDHTKE